MRCAQSGRSPWWMDQVSVASVSAGAPVASWSRAASAADGPNRPPCRCRSMLVSGCAWRWSSRRRRRRWPAATASRKCTWHQIRAICAASNVVRLGADSRTANSTVSASMIRPSVRPAAGTSRCSAARIREEVNRSDPATQAQADELPRDQASSISIPGSERPSGPLRHRKTGGNAESHG
jgi:hypothetical protein